MVRQTKLSPEGEVDCYPLSPMQQGMLFHRVSGGPRGLDIEQVVCELHEHVNAAKFEQAWREVVARHAALRTGFEWETGREPRQVVYSPARVRLALHHQDFGSDAEARRGLEEYLAADRREGFAELTPPLFRVALLRGGPAHFWFVTTYHHLLLDARSMTILFREVMELHDALVAGGSLELPKPRPYRNYIDWLQRQDASRVERYWREHLRGFTSPTALPIARAAARTSSDDGPGELAFRLPAKTMAGLRNTAQTHEVTVNTLVQAAWAVVLSRYSGEEDVVFGAVRACRKAPVDGIEDTIGLFINTVPVRVRVPFAAPLGPWLRELRQQWLGLREYEHSPLVRIQQWSDVPPGRPLFETILSYQEPSWDAALNALGGRWAHRIFDIRAQPSFPLALEVLAGTTLTVKAIHDRSSFASDSIAALLGHLRVVLEALASDAAETVGALPLLTPLEEVQLLVKWNDTTADFPRDRCVHELFEAHARTAPERIAVTDSSHAVSYRELNARANELACELKTHGVGPDALVAVAMNRSVEMIVAWLAVLKAGGAFVPLDPSYPRERMAFQIEDSAANVLLIQPEIRRLLPPLPRSVNLIEVTLERRPSDTAAEVDLPRQSAPNNLAYVIYTSGSTGQPKGVEIEHRALLNLVTWHQRTYGITPSDRATHLASPAFDAAVWEIWPYLASGASVHIPDDETRVAPAALWRWVRDQRVTLAFMPTPLAEAVISEPWPNGLALRALLTGGDKLKRRPPANFPCALVNHYGPTESAVVATSAIVAADHGAGIAPSIGRPIANTQVHVLDRHLRRVPAGVPGELYIGGASLARGYHRRPELTGEKFIPHPADRHPGSRVYRTGDLVRWTAGGELEFIGRSDNQVKIRGYRIELGEIEAAMQQHPAIQEAVVATRSDDRGEPQLVGFALKVAPGNGPTPAELTDHLRGKLPAHMVPGAVLLVDAWPLTPNGKIDRRALEAMAANTSSPAESRMRAGMEDVVGRVWESVLGRQGIRREDNFFDLGGHSLLAAQVVSRLNSTLRSSVSVRALFDQPTLAGFAGEVERRLGMAAAAPAQPVKRRVIRHELELVQPN